MKPNPRFLNKPKPFWAVVRSMSQEIGYNLTRKNLGVTKSEKIMKLSEIVKGKPELDPALIIENGKPTPLAIELHEYFTERWRVLIDEIEPKLLDAEKAEALYECYIAEFDHKCPIPMNKQRGDKRAVAFLTALVNMMVERHTQGLQCDYDPRRITTITRGGKPLRTMARHVDGAFPSTINPIAIWEIKEYYYTTTFGSRVADGVYETLLDGMEIEEVREQEDVEIKHYLMADGHYTWWECGKSYLCRMYDMLHMGYVDEILFGCEVVEEMPRIVGEWVEIHRKRNERIKLSQSPWT